MLKVFFYMIFLMEAFHLCSSHCTPSISTASGTHAPTGTICSGSLMFEDNFDEFDLKKWDHEQTLTGGGTYEFQWYANSRYNSYVENGTLYIQPTLLISSDDHEEKFLWSGTLNIEGGSPADACTNPIRNGCSRTGTTTNYLNPVKSARMRTVYSFSFKYGIVEVRAQIPSGDWLWPAIWFRPRYNQYSGWPISGEIDLMESRGNRNLVNSSGVNIGTQLVGSTLHWGPSSEFNKWRLTHAEKSNLEGFDTDFHVYKMIWTDNDITFFVDGEVLATFAPPDGGFWEWGNLDESGYVNPWKRNTKMAPFDQEFYILLNLAIGGNSFFPDSATNPGGKPWKNVDSQESYAAFWKGIAQWLPTWKLESDSAAFKIDYVRIWAL